ncbi:MAG TPA: hypothetical protein VHU84_10300 [Lacipirellulaceae bacterium]|jgi:hypothetical protein|nr:hypothetical protein [Lacipirellulaceae bacterium]
MTVESSGWAESTAWNENHLEDGTMSEIGCIFLSFLACGAAQETRPETVFTCGAIPPVSRADDSSRLGRLLTVEHVQSASGGPQNILVEAKADLAR